VVISLGPGAYLHMSQLIPLPLTVSCSRKSRLVYLSGRPTGSPASCHVISPSSLRNGWLHGLVSDVQLLFSVTVCSRLSPDRPVHWQMLSNQHIRCLPRFLNPSMRPTITLPSTSSCGCLITCPKYRSLRDLMCSPGGQNPRGRKTVVSLM